MDTLANAAARITNFIDINSDWTSIYRGQVIRYAFLANIFGDFNQIEDKIEEKSGRIPCINCCLKSIYLFFTCCFCILTCGFCCLICTASMMPSIKKFIKFDKVKSTIDHGDKYDKYEKQLNRKLSKATDLVRMMRF